MLHPQWVVSFLRPNVAGFLVGIWGRLNRLDVFGNMVVT